MRKTERIVLTVASLVFGVVAVLTSGLAGDQSRFYGLQSTSSVQERTRVISDARIHIVKVASDVCGSSNPTLRGSGWLLQEGGQYFTVTSEHVPLHAKDPTRTRFCHWIWSPYLGRVQVDVDFETADYYKGGALLRVIDPQALEKNAFEQVTDPDLDSAVREWQSGGLGGLALLAMRPLLESINVDVGGYSYGRAALSAYDESKRPMLPTFIRSVSSGSPDDLSNKSAPKILDTAFVEGFVPGISRLYLISDAYAQYGMSGGLVIGTESGQIVGLLSHKILEEHGTITRVRTLDGEISDAERAEGKKYFPIAIPSFELLDWLAPAISASLQNLAHKVAAQAAPTQSSRQTIGQPSVVQPSVVMIRDSDTQLRAARRGLRGPEAAAVFAFNSRFSVVRKTADPSSISGAALCKKSGELIGGDDQEGRDGRNGDIGGGDQGGGIGGPLVAPRDYVTAMIEPTAALSSHQQFYTGSFVPPELKTFESWFRGTLVPLMALRRLSVPIFVRRLSKRDDADRESLSRFQLEKICFGDLDEFFYRLKQSDFIPIVQILNESDSGADEDRRTARDLGYRLQNARLALIKHLERVKRAGDWEEQTSETRLKKLSQYLDQIETISLLSVSGAFDVMAIPDSVFFSVQESDVARSLYEITDPDFTEAVVELKTSVSALRRTLNLLRVTPPSDSGSKRK